jgi:hypothetical protein
MKENVPNIVVLKESSCQGKVRWYTKDCQKPELITPVLNSAGPRLK